MTSVASVASLRVASLYSGTMTPPMIPQPRQKIGRFCVKVTTDIIDANGLKRMSFKGYGPDEDVILKKTVQARDKHKNVDDSVTEPFITTIGICDLCDNRIEVHNIKSRSFYHLL